MSLHPETARATTSSMVKVSKITPGTLKKFRARHGLTQDQAAELLCVTRNTWGRWEMTATAYPMPAPVRRLIDILDGADPWAGIKKKPKPH